MESKNHKATGKPKPPPLPVEEASNDRPNGRVSSPCITPAECGFLRKGGIDPDAFEWCIPVESVILRNEGQLDGGSLARSPSGNIHLFRFSEKEGFQLVSFSETSVSVNISCEKRSIKISFIIEDKTVEQCIARINSEMASKASGHWLAYFSDAIGSHLKADDSDLLSLATVELLAPEKNKFKLHQKQSAEAAVVYFQNGKLTTFPVLDICNSGRLKEWNASDGEILFLYEHKNAPTVLSVKIHDTEASTFLSKTSKLLPEQKHAKTDAGSLRRIGKFTRHAESQDSPRNIFLRNRGDKTIVRDQTDSPRYIYGIAFENCTVLAAEDGSILPLSMPYKEGLKIVKTVNPIKGLIEDMTESGSMWGVALSGGKPITIHAKRDSFAFGGTIVPLSQAEDIVARKASNDLYEINASWTDEGARNEITMEMHNSAAFKLWEEWDVRRVEAGILQAGPAELYKQYNHAKKHNFLLVVFGDIVLLNRSLDYGMPMDDIIHKIQNTSAIKFAEDKDLFEETTNKIILLTSQLRLIKQKFELLSSMAPYYWSKEEAKWLSSVFGSKAATGCVAAERKRIVPLVRRQIRTVQSDLFRSIAQMEMAARPLDSIFAREEIQSHWSSKTRQLLPVAVQGTIGTIMLLTSQGILGWHRLGGSIATHGLGSILSKFQNDRESANQVKRAAETIFPWWQVFMNTLVVSVFETAEFMDNENARCMERDKQLLDSTGDKRQDFAGRLEKLLRCRILGERRNSFAEIVEGSGVRLAEVLSDIEQAIGSEMRSNVDEFANNLVLAGKKTERKETGHG